MIIDSHQHFWTYTEAEFGWIDDRMSAIRRDFLPRSLFYEIDPCGVSGTVAVQARQSLEETGQLMLMADENHWIQGVVGWVPLRDPNVAAHLERLSSFARFKGVRHVLQAEPDEFMEDSAFNEGIRKVSSLGKVYDLLIVARQLPAAIRFVDRHPGLPIVLDHIAKPTIAGLPPAEWVDGIRDLARRDHVVCKFSGLVTEVVGEGWRWTPELLKPYFEVVLEAFGPQRLMFGSDWPVCLVASQYVQWLDFVKECVACLSKDEQAAILGANADRVYDLRIR